MPRPRKELSHTLHRKLAMTDEVSKGEMTIYVVEQEQEQEQDVLGAGSWATRQLNGSGEMKNIDCFTDRSTMMGTIGSEWRLEDRAYRDVFLLRSSLR